MSKKPRHASLAEQLKALKIYRDKPEGSIQPLTTNWSATPDNDNNREDLDGLYIERRSAVRPTISEIMDAVKNGEVRRNDKGQIVGIGKLEFSDGNQTEKAYRYGADGEVITYDARMPVGAMLGTTDRQERVLGGDAENSNAAYTDVYGARHTGKVRRKSRSDRDMETPAPERTKLEMRAELAALPPHPVTVCKPGFPWKPSNLRELFMGLEKGKKGESGVIAWEDISSHITEREAWEGTMSELTDEDKRTLDTAMTAENMSDIGRVFGKTGKNAERQGKARLIGANDNFAEAIKKMVA